MEPKIEVALRKNYRGQLTKLCKAVNEVVNSPETLPDELSFLCEKIKLLRVTLNELNEKIASTLSDDLIVSESEKVVEYDLNAVDAIANLEVVMKRKKSGYQPPLQQSVVDVGVGNVQTQSNQNSIRLPKLDLLKFNGDLEAWPAFWEQYSQAIHNNLELSMSCKFTYLKSLLTGKAALTISGLTSSQNSYNDAIDLIKSEYGQPERIIDCYVQKLCSIPHVKYDKDIASLRRLYNTASSITCSLESLGISADQYGLMVKSMIFKVLPYSLRVQFNKIKIQSAVNEIDQCTRSGSVNLEPDLVNYKTQIADLLNFIKIEVDALEQAHSNENKDNKFHASSRENHGHSSRTEPQNRFKTTTKETFTAQGLLSVTSDQCLFCKNKNHLTKDCLSTFMSLNNKKKLLQDSNRCFRCTGQNHRSKFCKTKDIVCKKCKGRHVTALCDPSFKPKNKNESNDEQNHSSNEQSTVTAFSTGRLENVYLQTACVFVKSNNDDNEMFIRAVFDAGSQLTYIKQCVSRELNLPIIGKHKISVCVFGSSKRGAAKLCNRVEVVLKSQYSDKLITIHAIEAPEICFDAIKPPCLSDPVIENFMKRNRLADIQTKPLNSDGISLLIGSENYWLLVTGETRPLTDKLRAINTEVGWTIHGAVESNNVTPEYSFNFNVVTVLHSQSDLETDLIENDNLNLKKFWDLETIGISGSEIKVKDNFTDKFMENNVIFKDNRYEVTLPWQSDNILDSNYTGAFVRVKNLVNKLCKSGTLLEYDRAIREYERLGCAELVSDNDVNHNQTYYLPHRPVYRRDKETSQVRVVFDASAHAPGMPSLNDKLITGENLVPDLLKILINFRIGSVALVADIEKAFLQISVSSEDRDYLRFLWFKDPIINEVSSVDQLASFVTFRMCRVTFGVTTSPFLLAVTLRKHLLNQPDREFGKYLLESFYIDDFVKSVQSEEVALEVYERSKNILSEANMNMRKWCSNNANLMKKLNETEVDSKGLESSNQKKVLGINWFTITDQLVMDVSRIFKDSNVSKTPTKRIILQAVGRIFDPIGVLGVCTITPKLLLQKIWKKCLKWDQPLPNEFEIEWNQWIQDMSNLSDYAIPRCILPNRKEPVELHIFADASPHAYGSVAYLKRLNNNDCNFLMSKNRVAPLNQTLTLPKLELTAALCAARLQRYVIENIDLNITEIFIWSDSKIVLYWINGNKYKWKPFVQNRVQEIRNMNRITWKYCPGKENPADLLTRGIQASKLLKESERWLHGPTWLSSSREDWPENQCFDPKLEEATIFCCLTETIEEINIEDNEDKITVKQIFSLDKFCSYEKVLRVTAYICRFLNNIKTKEQERKITGYIRTKEMENAETYWIRIAQQEKYAEEINALRKNREISKKSEILKLNPFLDEKYVLRLKGRLQESSLNYNERHPIIIPKKSELSKKLIWNAHEQIKHGGINSTLAEIRQKYWIIQGRQRIKSVIGCCVICKKLKGKSGTQPFAPLPRDRITMAQPFNVTGIDFAGPLYIFKKEQKIKVYIMLFTCAVIRAVHLELVENLTTKSCILGIRRFIARRGVPSIIYSDNAKTFKRTALELEELAKILQHEEIQDLARKKRIHWKFSVERGAWWGGFWERLVRTVKGALKATLLKKRIGFDELRTILVEVESTVNSRPLTYIEEDTDNLFILTPGKFLIGEVDLGFSPNLKSKEITRNEILKIWKGREEAMRQFWKRWQADYLKQLRSAHYMDNPRSNNIKEGDVVLLQDQDRPRLLWKLARVIQTFKGRDGRVRSCEIKTSNGDKLKRPVQCLYPLEIDSFAAGEDVDNCA